MPKPAATTTAKFARRYALLAALAWVLLAAQTLVTTHSVDIKAHSTNDPCKICLTLAGVATGDVPSVASLPVVPQTAEVIVALAVVLDSHRYITVRARGPPLAS